MRRRVVVLLAAVLMAVSLAGCKNEDKADEVVRQAIRRTERMARRYTYTDESDGRIVTVQGVIEDDFRHAERMAIDDSPAIDEVTSDDALAIRFLDESLVPRFVGGGGGTVDVPGGPAGVPVTDVLATHRWVVDKEGAPTVLGKKLRATGADPVFDSLSVLRYVEAAADAALFVRVFNPEALDYKPAEDPFPHPEKGVKRYDLQRPPLPRADAGGGGGGGANQAVPDVQHFRRMAIYVRDGLVIEVREAIDIETRLRELARVYGVKFPDRPKRELAKVAVDAMNALRTGQGDEPIRVRAMVLKFTELGTPQKVTLPTDALAASLDLRQADEDKRRRGSSSGSGSGSSSGPSGSGSSGSSSGSGAESSASSTTTTTAPAAGG